MNLVTRFTSVSDGEDAETIAGESHDSEFTGTQWRFLMLFTIGDYVVGALIGVGTAIAVRLVIAPGLDMVIAMLAGAAIGVIIHAVLGLILSPVFGLMETMIPGSLIGMYGGMLFGMRDSMAAGSRTLAAAAAVGALFGAVVVLGVKVYDRSLRGTVLDAGG